VLAILALLVSIVGLILGIVGVARRSQNGLSVGGADAAGVPRHAVRRRGKL